MFNFTLQLIFSVRNFFISKGMESKVFMVREYKTGKQEKPSSGVHYTETIVFSLSLPNANLRSLILTTIVNMGTWYYRNSWNHQKLSTTM
jgi:hypothetical protein